MGVRAGPQCLPLRPLREILSPLRFCFSPRFALSLPKLLSGMKSRGGLASSSFPVSCKWAQMAPCPFCLPFRWGVSAGFEGAGRLQPHCYPVARKEGGCPRRSAGWGACFSCLGGPRRFSAAHVSSSPRTLGSKCRWPMTVCYLPIFPMTPRLTPANGDISSLRKPELLVVFTGGDSECRARRAASCVFIRPGRSHYRGEPEATARCRARWGWKVFSPELTQQSRVVFLQFRFASRLLRKLSTQLCLCPPYAQPTLPDLLLCRQWNSGWGWGCCRRYTVGILLTHSPPAFPFWVAFYLTNRIEQHLASRWWGGQSTGDTERRSALYPWLSTSQESCERHQVRKSLLPLSPEAQSSWEALGPSSHICHYQTNPKRNQPWMFIRRTDAEAEAPILWPPDAKSWLIGKDPGSGKIEGRRSRGRQRMRWLDGITDSIDAIWANSGR